MEFTGLPRMARIRQQFTLQRVENIKRVIHDEFIKAEVGSVIQAGDSVAVTVGSRGISNIFEIMKCLVDELLAMNARPFIVPSMGSHGGATAEGQKKLLAIFNITEDTMGIPIRSSMEVVRVGEIDSETPVFIDKNAYDADHIFVANRVKPHTDFEGANESGLMKMVAIGLGKQKGADLYHNRFIRQGHVSVITAAARVLLRECKIPFGLGIVENQVDETAHLEIHAGHHFEESERVMLEKAKSYLPRIPFDTIDLLIVDEIGKHFSGTGMDQNIIARSVVNYHVVPNKPSITRIFVRDIDKASGGNGLGIGNADFTTNRFIEKYDRQVSYMNSITAACPEITRIPTYLDNDREVVETAYKTIPIAASADSRVVWIKNTLHLEEMYISEAMVEAAEINDRVELLSGSVEVGYDEEGNLLHP